jgi:hypothetical protein
VQGTQQDLCMHVALPMTKRAAANRQVTCTVQYSTVTAFSILVKELYVVVDLMMLANVSLV